MIIFEFSSSVRAFHYVSGFIFVPGSAKEIIALTGMGGAMIQAGR
jgi:hypothetical protein